MSTLTSNRLWLCQARKSRKSTRRQVFHSFPSNFHSFSIPALYYRFVAFLLNVFIIIFLPLISFKLKYCEHFCRYLCVWKANEKFVSHQREIHQIVDAAQFIYFAKSLFVEQGFYQIGWENTFQMEGDRVS